MLKLIGKGWMGAHERPGQRRTVLYPRYRFNPSRFPKHGSKRLSVGGKRIGSRRITRGRSSPSLVRTRQRSGRGSRDRASAVAHLPVPVRP